MDPKLQSLEIFLSTETFAVKAYTFCNYNFLIAFSKKGLEKTRIKELLLVTETKYFERSLGMIRTQSLKLA